MDNARTDTESVLLAGVGEPPTTRNMLQPGEAFARMIEELELGEWALHRWAVDLGISDDEMFIEVDRRLHHSAAA